MNRCSVCGRTVSNKTAHFGLGCLKNMCSLIDMEKTKNLKGENLLNTRISKITKKKLLNKEEKTLLTNRYLTLGLNYVSSDLFLALNNTTINVIGNKEDENWKLNITITDRYDFTDFKEIDEYCDDDVIKGLLGSAANNLAMVSVDSGVMHEYNVTIKFEIDKWEVQ